MRVQRRHRSGQSRFCDVRLCPKPRNQGASTGGARSAQYDLHILDYETIHACDGCMKQLKAAWEDNGGAAIEILPYKPQQKKKAA